MLLLLPQFAHGAHCFTAHYSYHSRTLPDTSLVEIGLDLEGMLPALPFDTSSGKKKKTIGHYDHRESPFTCLRLLEFGIAADGAPSLPAFGVMFSSPPVLDKGSMVCREDRPAVVRGSLLFAALPDPLMRLGVPFRAPLPSLLVGRNGVDPLIALRCCLFSLSPPK